MATLGGAKASPASPRRTPSGPHVAVVGGGVIGLSVAYHLAKEGAAVTVVEAGRLGGGTSRVSAGMLAPLAEAEGPSPMLDLTLAGLRYHKQLAEELREESGVDVELVPSGIVRVASTEEEEKLLRHRFQWQASSGMKVQWLSPSDLRDMESGVFEGGLGGIYSEGEVHLSAPRLVRALAEAAARRGAAFRESTIATGLVRRNSRVMGVRLGGEELAADSVVLAPGSWAAGWGKELQLSFPVSPVKGQLVSVRLAPAPIRHIVWSGLCYLVTKRDDTIVIGTTQEEAGFDMRATAAGMAEILRMATALVPAVGQAEFVRVQAGLRPECPDHTPMLGEAPGWHGAVLAMGHYRNGVLLSGITGRLLSQLILGKPTELPLGPFSASRFQG